MSKATTYVPMKEFCQMWLDEQEMLKETWELEMREVYENDYSEPDLYEPDEPDIDYLIYGFAPVENLHDCTDVNDWDDEDILPF